jgi:GAF domain-containing protein
MRISRLLNAVLLFLLGTVVVVLVGILAFMGLPATLSEGFTALAAVVMGVAVGVFLFLARRGRIWLSSTLLLSLMWLILTTWIVTEAGINSDSSTLSFAIIVVLAGLLLGGRGAMIFTVLGSLSMLVAYYLEVSGRLVIVPRPLSPMDPFLIVVQLGFIGLLLRHAVNSMLDAMRRAQRNERAQVEANRQLETLRASLEQRVRERTQDLARRTTQLQAAAEVGRAVTSILEMETLIWEVSELLLARFGLYHVGLFEVDSTGQWAEYRAGAGAAGRALAEERFRLKVGGESLVGWCTAHARERTIQDVEGDTGRMEHPLVPRTRSEAALPLIARGEVIGALSVQSDEPGAFDEVTVSSLQTVADQVAVALDNARLFTESQQALEAMRRAYGQVGRDAWIELMRGRGEWGYSYAYRSVTPAGSDWPLEMLQALETGQSVQTKISNEAVLAVPLQMRDHTIGVLSFYKSAGEGSELQTGSVEWTEQEIRVLEQIIQQMGVALESARLYEDARRRTAREQLIGEVTTRMRETLDVETVIKTTADEMYQALGLDEVVIRLVGDQASRYSGDG